MPGLVVVSGREGADVLARRAAAPLVRRPWERLSLAASPDGTVALGFAGERGAVLTERETGRIAAFDGELHGAAGVRTGTPAAAELLERFRADGPWFDPPEGAFAAAIWDPATQRLVLVTDRYADRPIYVTRRNGTLLAAGELKALLAAGIDPALDLQAAAETLAYYRVVSDRSLVEGVRLLPGGTTLVAEGGKLEERRRWRYRLRPEAGHDRELVGEFGRLLDGAVAARLDGSEALSLSGGFDSRCVALALARRGVDCPTATWGVGGSRDPAIAARVARRLGFRHLEFAPERGYVARGAPLAVWLGEWRKHAFRSEGLSLLPLRDGEGIRALLLGTKGDNVTRLRVPPRAGPGATAFAAAAHARIGTAFPDELHADLLTPAFAGRLRGLAAAGLAEALAADDGDRPALLAQLSSRNPMTLSLASDWLAPRDPFAGHALVDFCARLPYRLRLGGALQRAYLRSSRATAWVPMATSHAPGWTGPLERIAAAGNHAKAAARRKPGRVLPASRQGGPRPYLLHAFDLPDGAWRTFGILLEPRTLARGQVREEGVRRLVERLAAGDRDAMPPLGALLGLELFERQFLDGDGGPDG